VQMALGGRSTWAGSKDSLTIQGTIPAVTQITVTSISSVEMTLKNITRAQPIAVVTERNNSLSGYTVTLASVNASLSNNGQPHLRSSSAGTTSTINYSIAYGVE